MNIFEEISWPQFVKIERINKLPLHEQVAAYQQYIYDLDIARQNWLNYQNKGPLVESGFLAQEESYYDGAQLNYFALLQEDGSKIIIT